MKRVNLFIPTILILLCFLSCSTLADQIRSTSYPTLEKAVFTSALNSDGSPTDERTVFSPYEKIYLALYIKNAVANKTVIKMNFRDMGIDFSKYITSTRDGNQWVGIDTGITDLFEIPALKDGKKYMRMKLDQVITFSWIRPEDGVLLIDSIPIVVAK